MVIAPDLISATVLTRNLTGSTQSLDESSSMKFLIPEDIQVFLQDGFAKICAKESHSVSLKNNHGPEEGIVGLLV